MFMLVLTLSFPAISNVLLTVSYNWRKDRKKIHSSSLALAAVPILAVTDRSEVNTSRLSDIGAWHLVDSSSKSRHYRK